MQYRVLLVDDDPRITANLLEFVDWAALGYDRPQTAQDSKSALALAAALSFDVILTDISMPDMNGMELIQRMQALSPQTQFIVLSGYGTFDYAREAIRLGVKHFLTKPTDLDEVTAAFTSVQEGLEKRRSSDERYQRQTRAMSQTLTNALDHMFADLRGGGKAPSSLAYLLEAYDPRFARGYYALMRVRLGSSAELLEKCSSSLQLLARTQAQRLNIRIYYIPSSCQNFYLFLNFEEETCPERLARELALSHAALGGQELHCGLSRVCTSLAALDGCFQQADQALLEAVYQQSPLQCWQAVQTASPESVPPEDRLGELLENVPLSVLEQQLDACLPAALTADQAVQLLLSAMQRLGSAGEAVALYWGQTDCAAPYTLHTEAELRAWLKECLLQLKRGVQQSSTSLNVRAIQRAKAYIHQNYMLDISLEQVSRHVNMSPNYFSSVFAEVAGVHFIDYVTGVRITHALELLMNDSIPIYTVCEKVGYRNSRYFSQIFRTAIGCTPSHFRQQNGKGVPQ